MDRCFILGFACAAAVVVVGVVGVVVNDINDFHDFHDFRDEHVVATNQFTTLKLTVMKVSTLRMHCWCS